MSRPTNSFQTLAGVPVHYDRLPGAYGTRGIPHTFHATVGLEKQLDVCFTELWALCPLGKADLITSAGAYVDKPGQHGEGKAFDLDGIFWRTKTFVTLEDGFKGKDVKFYLAVESVIRRHFGVVLDFEYNAPHRDHFHIVEGATTGFQRTRSRTVFLQLALRHFCRETVSIDGEWGPETAGALTRGLRTLGLSGDIRQKSTWLSFLEKVVRLGFGEPAGLIEPVVESETPLKLLHSVYGSIDETLGAHPGRAAIGASLNAFANHSETKAWLEQFRD